MARKPEYSIYGGLVIFLVGLKMLVDFVGKHSGDDAEEDLRANFLRRYMEAVPLFIVALLFGLFFGASIFAVMNS